MSNEITIIIPSHERHSLLSRAIHYYSELNFLVLIVDSSELCLEINLPKNIKYFHLPRSFFSNKIHYALSITSSPFVCLCADDDFLSESGLFSGKDFLERNLDFVSVQGNYIHFDPTNPLEIYNPLYKKMNGYKNDSEFIEERVKDSYKVPHIFALHRTNVLISALNISIDMESVTIVEETVALVTMFHGKHCVLPVFWCARDSVRYSNYIDELGNNDIRNTMAEENDSKLNKVILNWESFLQTTDGKKLKNNYIKEVSGLTNESINIEALFDFSQSIKVDQRIRFIDSQANITSIFYKGTKDFIKLLLPNLIVKKIQLFSVNKEKSKLKIIPGFPWSDSIAMDDWVKITNSIIKFRDLIN